MHTIEAFICIIACVGTLLFSYGLTFIIPHRWKNAIVSVSRNVNSIYCIHWVLVWWTVDLAIYCIKGDRYLSTLPAFLLGLTLSILSILLAQIYSRFKIKRKRTVIDYEKDKEAAR